MNKLITVTIAWIKEDWASNHIRCVLEILAWFMSVGANVMFMLTVPHVPFLAYLTLTVLSSAIFAWSLWTRGSLGGLANYGFIVTVDTIALTKVIIG
jgi:cytochrome bd-type quinol oxidase subunit 1